MLSFKLSLLAFLSRLQQVPNPHFERPIDSFLPQKDRELLRLELYMARRVNEERAALGLSFLGSDALLAAVARAHSAEMRDLGYFAHESPTPHLRTPGDRYEYAFGHSYTFISENVSMRTWSRSGYGPEELIERWARDKMNIQERPTQSDVEESHVGLMHSPGHRANILEPTIEIMGIGLVNRNRDLWATQMFSRRTYS